MLATVFCIPFYVFLCVSKPVPCSGGGEAPIVHVKQGQIQGIRDKSLNGAEFFSYLSIPYARPPERNLRFKDPLPLESWDGILNGTTMPVACLQTSFYPLNYKDGITSCVYGREDCLYLNVFTPSIWGLSPLYILPRVDGEFIDEAPETLMKNRKYNKVDIIAGIMRDEGGLDLKHEYRIHNRRENFNKNFEKFGPISLFFEDEKNSLNLTKQVYQYYLKRDNFTVGDEDWKEIVEMSSDRMFKVSHDIVANFFAADPDVKLYTYELDHVGQVSATGDIPGFTQKKIITHGDDMVYLSYDGKSLRLKLENEDDLRVREIFLNLWTNFAKTGNPTPSGSNFTWNEATTQTFRHLSLTPTPVMKDDNFKAKREFWSSLKTSQNALLQNTSK